jgi:N-acetylmuramoyl-L-alanine amidase
MNNFLDYLLQVSAVLILLYLPYQLLFRKETRFTLNRSYLLAILIICWIIPLVNIPVGTSAPEFQAFRVQIETPIMENTGLSTNLPEISQPSNQSIHFNWLMLYWLGVAFMLIRNLWIIVRIIRLSQRSARYATGRIQFIVRDDIPAFTFFRKIFLNRAEYELANNSLVLRHELAHLRQKHTWDLILAELVHTILWFNPILILIKNAFKETHEYQADRTVLSEGFDFEQYALSLQTGQVQSGYQNLVNYFNGSTLKKRIIMATTPTDSKSIRKYFLIIPVLISCLILWSFIQDPVGTGNPKETGRNLIVLIDPGHGGKDPGATNSKITKNEKDFNLALAKSLETVPHEGIDFIFTRTTDNYVTLGSRYNLAEKNHADLLLELHMNANKNSNIRGPELIYSAKNLFPDVSRKICQAMGSQLKTRVFGPNKEPFSTANLVVLTNAKCPAVHFSFGYITNDDDAKTYSSPENLESLAKKIIENLQEIKFSTGLIPFR